jgi:hypothetical protein
LSLPDECYSNLSTLSLPDEGYSNLSTLSLPDEGYSNLLTLSLIYIIKGIRKLFFFKNILIGFPSISLYNSKTMISKLK